MTDKKLETLAYRLKDLESLRNLFSELNFDFTNKPVNKDNWSDEQKVMVKEARIIASKNDYQIYYIQTNTDSLKEWKGIATKIIKDNHGFCMICSHNPSGFKWVFSSLSKEFSKSFTETRHVPIDIKPDTGVPKTFVGFLEKIRVDEKTATSSIVSKISDAFDSFAIQIHDELTANVFKALKTLSEGIILDKSNNLELNEQTLEEIREPTFILLYRIMFVLYAEDRAIFPDEKFYNDNFSLKWIKSQWILKYDRDVAEYIVYERLKKLFRLIAIGSEDLGYDPKEFFMRSYYGRLFDRNIHCKLEEWNIPNQNLLNAIGLLTRTIDKKGNYFFLDYAALETRHLGAIYERLLEYHLTIKDGKVADLPNAKERKSTGSYYTPKYIVDYIIENAVGPLIDEIIKKTDEPEEQIDKILDLNILDPAMGSGHFLVGATNYIARRICEIEYKDQITESVFVECKRDVARRCIYGIDINPLAVDLASVSLWLETLSSERPLSFFSAHLKTGNSLIGSSIEDILEKQTTLVESTKGRTRFKKTVKDFIMLEMLEDDTAEAVKTKTTKYNAMQSQGTVYYDLKSRLNVKSAKFFDVDIPPIGDYVTKTGESSLDYYSDERWQQVQKISEEYSFFHWDLEFPDIFYSEDGKRKENQGFDAVVGNPPYLNIKGIRANNPQVSDYFKMNYQSATERYDLYVLFIEKCAHLLKQSGCVIFILPHKFTNANFGIGIRKFLTEKKLLDTLLSFGHNYVFKDSTTYTGILTLSHGNNILKFYEIQKPKTTLNSEINILRKSEFLKIKLTDLTKERWLLADENTRNIFKKIKLSGPDLTSYFDKIMSGAQTGDNRIYFVSPIKRKKHTTVVYSKKIQKEIEIENELLKPLLMGLDVKRYKKLENTEHDILYPYLIQNNSKRQMEEDEFKSLYPLAYSYLSQFEDELVKLRTDFKTNPKYWFSLHRSREIKWFEQEKIVTPEISHGCNMTLDTKNFYHNEKVYSFIKKTSNMVDNRYFLGILNSKLLWFYLKNTGDVLRGGYFTFKSQYLKSFHIPYPSKSVEKTIVDKVSMILNLHEKSLEQKTRNQIYEIEKDLNNLVYDLYQLDDHEIALVEKNYPTNTSQS